VLLTGGWVDVGSSRVDERLGWRSLGTYARGGEERSKVAVGARRGMAALCRFSQARRMVSKRIR
jgi:hypothetical protein